MTPKEKAQQLIDQFDEYADARISDNGNFTKKYCSKQCALIAVNEILNLEPPELSYMEPFSNSWWQEVKLEIEKL